MHMYSLSALWLVACSSTAWPRLSSKTALLEVMDSHHIAEAQRRGGGKVTRTVQRKKP